MNWASGILNASQASYLPLQNNAILTNRRFEFVGSTHPHRSKMQPMPKILVLQGFLVF
jgi:hypothetical protein